MIFNKRSKYKSWSNLKKQMNDLLCDSLKAKINYINTSYREVHNVYGRASISYLKTELVNFTWDMGFDQFREEYKIYLDNRSGLQTQPYLEDVSSGWGQQIKIGEFMMKERWMPEGTLCQIDFINAVTLFLNTDISSALCSDNYLLRVFAYMDRRVGKRTLVKIKDETDKLPDWVKQFYRIRCEAEGIFFPSEEVADTSSFPDA